MTAQRFFRRYFLTGIGLILLFLVANGVMLLGLSMAIDRVSAFRAPLDELAACVQAEGGGYRVRQAEITALLEGSGLPWAMVLDAEGGVVWSWQLPPSLRRDYTAADVARFSRWYLEDYPVLERVLDGGGLLVVAGDKDRLVRLGLSNLMSLGGVRTMLYGGLGIVAANLLLVVALFWRSTRRMEQSAAPLMEGIGKIAAGQPAALPETGELAPVQKALNRVSAQMARRDAARAEWINGISHDVRTPLSVILGYAGTLAADPALSPAARQQAGMICAQGERLRDLIRDLNLVSQLEYSMQPLQWRHLDPVELARGVLSELLNGGLDSRYVLELQTAGREDTIEGDPALLARALENLVRNSIRHNPGGCTVTVTVDREPETCRFTVQDDGVGMAAAAMEQANAGQFEAAQNGAQHGFGLRLVYGIAAAHGGTMACRPVRPTGLEVTITLPAARARDGTAPA